MTRGERLHVSGREQELKGQDLRSLKGRDSVTLDKKKPKIKGAFQWEGGKKATRQGSSIRLQGGLW